MKPNEQIPLFDEAESLERLADDSELLANIISIFCEYVPEQILVLKSKLEQKKVNGPGFNSCSEIEREFHSMAGASANIGASRLSQFCKNLEDKSRAKKVIEEEELFQLEKLLSETILIIQDWKSSNSL